MTPLFRQQKFYDPPSHHQYTLLPKQTKIVLKSVFLNKINTLFVVILWFPTFWSSKMLWPPYFSFQKSMTPQYIWDLPFQRKWQFPKNQLVVCDWPDIKSPSLDTQVQYCITGDFSCNIYFHTSCALFQASTKIIHLLCICLCKQSPNLQISKKKKKKKIRTDQNLQYTKIYLRDINQFKGLGRDRIYDQIPLKIWYTVI